MNKKMVFTITTLFALIAVFGVGSSNVDDVVTGGGGKMYVYKVTVKCTNPTCKMEKTYKVVADWKAGAIRGADILFGKVHNKTNCPVRVDSSGGTKYRWVFESEQMGEYKE